MINRAYDDAYMHRMRGFLLPKPVTDFSATASPTVAVEDRKLMQTALADSEVAEELELRSNFSAACDQIDQDQREAVSASPLEVIHPAFRDYAQHLAAHPDQVLCAHLMPRLSIRSSRPFVS